MSKPRASSPTDGFARRWASSAAGALSGLLFALAFPPFASVLLLPVALVPWLVALFREESRARALVSGLVFGLVYWCTSIPWIVYVVTHYGGQSGAMGVVCLAILAAILAEWPALAAWGTVAAAPPGSLRRVAVFPLLWMASEHARTFVYGGFPWNLTAHALFGHPIWIQSSAVWGAFGVGGLVVSVSSLFAGSLLRRKSTPAWAAMGLAAAAGVFGAARLALVAGRESGRPLSVALLQPNVRQEERAEGRDAQAYRTVIAMARDAARDRPGLIVVPESAFPAYWDTSAILRRDLSEIARNSRILFNDVGQEPDGRYYNEARLLGAEGLIGRPYRKVHLVPFGEYVPLPKLFFFVRQISSEIGEFSAAAAPSTLGADGERIGVGVCYEILYPGLTGRTSSSPSRTTPGTAARERRNSISPAPFSAPSRPGDISCAPRSPGFPESWTRQAGSAEFWRATGQASSGETRDSSTAGRPGRRGDISSRGSRTPSASPCYSSASSVGSARAEDRRLPRREPESPRPGAFHDRTRRSHPISLERLGAARLASGLSLIPTPRGARSRSFVRERPLRTSGRDPNRRRTSSGRPAPRRRPSRPFAVWTSCGGSSKPSPSS
jgi:apolipoprotein N-acyltransferase